MAKVITFDDIAYLVRGNYTRAQLLALYASYCRRYGSHLTLHQWMVQRGKAHTSQKRRR